MTAENDVRSTALVDVGIPACGRSAYVAQAVESVLGQSLGSWRLTIAEDGDSAGKIARAVEPYLGDPRVRYLESDERIGAAGNLTRLIRTGTAPYVAILHDDDRWRPEFLERRAGFLDTHPECGFVFSPVAVIDRNGRETERSRAVLPVGVHRPEQVVPLMLRRNLVRTPTVVVRRTAYEAVGARFDEQLVRIYDYEMWLRLAVRFPVGYLASHDAEWRLHPEQSTRSVADRRSDFVRLLARTDVLLQRELPSCRPSARQRGKTLADWLLTNALDAVEQGLAGVALSDLSAALRAYPPAALDVRTPVLLVALAGGSSGRRQLSRLRSVVRRHGIEVHPLRFWQRRVARTRSRPGGDAWPDSPL